MSKQVKQTATYFLEVDGVASGPVTLAFIHEGIRNGELNEHDLIWKEGSKAKVELKSVQGLKSLFATNPAEEVNQPVNESAGEFQNDSTSPVIPPAINSNQMSLNESNGEPDVRFDAKPFIGGPIDSEPANLNSTKAICCRNCSSVGSLDDDACATCGCLLLSGNKYCCCCGAETDPNAVYCLACKTNLVMFTSNAESGIIRLKTPAIDPLLALFSSMVVVGLGQFILGQRAKGVFQFFLFSVLGWVTVGVMSTDPDVSIVFLIALILAYLGNAFDAYFIGRQLKEKGKMKTWDFFFNTSAM